MCNSDIYLIPSLAAKGALNFKLTNCTFTYGDGYFNRLQIANDLILVNISQHGIYLKDHSSGNYNFYLGILDPYSTPKQINYVRI